jgi:Tol biopolymer transport system component/DNA-binding winged helix-turn-helix (wHTH) protein
MVTAAQQRTVRFGRFEVDLFTAELFKAGRKVDLERQPFLVLALLLKRRGELVTRDELRAALWPDGSFVDFNQGLNVAVKKLRDALGDSSENPRFIETLSRRGYRFIAPIDWVQDKTADQVSQPEATQQSLSPWMWAGAMLALATAILLYWRVGSSRSSDTANLELRPTPLTSYPGFERSPALSPDGRQVAFSWDGEGQNNSHIYLKLLDTANPVRLTKDPASDDMPTWAPDGRKIAFVRTEKSRRSAIRVIPALGGPEREVAELAPGECYTYGTLSWSPDGEWLAFADKDKPIDPFTLYMVSVATGEKRKITYVNKDLYGDALPAFSPDGHSLAFVRLKDYSVGDIYLRSLGGGQVRPLTHDGAGVFGLSWTADSKDLVFSSDRAGDARLWRIASSGGTPQPLLGISGPDAARGVSVRGHTLVFGRESSDQNIWRLPVQGPKMTGPPKQLSVSTRDDMNPQPSPDGKRIAFSSNRSGSLEIWVSDSDGLNPMQVTSIGRGTNVWATWSPDGRFLAFNSNISGNWGIYVVDSRGGRPRALTTRASEDAAPSWSRDGRWIYYQSNRSGTLQIWRISPQGGTPLQVTKSGGSRPAVSGDNKFIYYARSGGIWRVPADGGEEISVLSGIPDAEAGHWVAANGGLYFLGHQDSRAVLNFMNFKTRRISPIMLVEKPWDVSALAVSPDGRSLLYDQIDQSGSDLMFVEKFR